MRARRSISIAMGVAAIVALSGCIAMPPQAQQPPPQTSTPVTSPSTPAPPSETPWESPEPLFEYTTDASATSVWSFEPIGAEIVESDYDGTPADPGYVLVVLYIDGQRISETGDFYWDFRVGSVNPDTDQFIGLSSATDFYANNDLFTAGQLENFRAAAAIYQVPEGWPLGDWRFTFHETGEQWDLEVPVDGA